MDRSVIARIQALRNMTVTELQAEWLKLFGEPSRSRNRSSSPWFISRAVSVSFASSSITSAPAARATPKSNTMRRACGQRKDRFLPRRWASAPAQRGRLSARHPECNFILVVLGIPILGAALMEWQ